MGISVLQLLLILIIVFVLFGAGKLPKMMGDLGKGIKNLKDGLGDKESESKPTVDEPKIVNEQTPAQDQANETKDDTTKTS